ncbi:hypothetical protein [Sphingomonas phage Kimi]|nr:hypothetical protein [Sphingomonas phage Kimi]
MALKHKINKAAYDKLSDELKAEYIAGDNDGEYVLDVTGLPEPEDTGPLKRALEAEKTRHKETKAKLDTANATISEFPDVDKLKADHAKETGKYKAFTENALVDGAAQALAAKISTSPAIMLPHIKSRLVADVTGETPVTKVLDKDGKPSDLTIEKLGEEMVANKDFAAIIIGSKASGGGAPRVPAKPLGGGAPQGEQAPDLSKMQPGDLAARIAAKKAADGQQAQQ